MQKAANFPVYQIEVEGLLDPRWSAWLPGQAAIQASGDSSATTITVPVADQAALRGILNRLWDLNLTLVSVTRLA